MAHKTSRFFTRAKARQEEAERLTRIRRVPMTVRPKSNPAHRQPVNGDTRGDSWWLTTERDCFAQVAQAELTRMVNSREGRRWSRQISEGAE